MKNSRNCHSGNQSRIKNPVTNFDDSLDDCFDEAMMFHDIFVDSNDSINLTKRNFVPEENSRETSAKIRKINTNLNTQSSDDNFPYYGLPSKVEILVNKFKGISKVYGEFCLNFFFIS